MLIELLRMAEFFSFSNSVELSKTPVSTFFFVFSSLATISPSSCLLPFQSFNPLFLRPFFLFFGFPFCFPLRIFFTFPVFPLPFPCAYARGLALLTRV